MTTFSNIDPSVFDSTPEIADLQSQMQVIKTAGEANDAAIPTKADIAGQLFTGNIGYNANLRGTITQVTSKSTSVTLNTITGVITTHNASLAANTKVSFTVTNSSVSLDDAIVAHRQSGGTAGAYTISIDSVANGSFVITVHNTTAGSLGEAIVIKFLVLKG